MKTVPNKITFREFMDGLSDEKKIRDCHILVDIMKRVTGEEPVMWGDSIVGFGTYHYKYESGREGDWFLTGFSPRKQNMTIYLMNGFSRYQEYLDRLGKNKNSVSCLYVKNLSDIDLDVLESMVRDSVEYLKSKYNS